MIKSRCPACSKTLNAAFRHGDGAGPSQGDLTLCCYCAAPAVFQSDFTLRCLGSDEYAALEPELKRELELYQRMVFAMPEELKRGTQ